MKPLSMQVSAIRSKKEMKGKPGARITENEKQERRTKIRSLRLLVIDHKGSGYHVELSDNARLRPAIYKIDSATSYQEE